MDFSWNCVCGAAKHTRTSANIFFFIFQSTGIFVSALLSHKVCSHNLKKRSVLAYIDILKNLASNAPILRARVFFTCFYPISIHLDISHWLANACISFWSQRQPAAVIFKINILACVCVWCVNL